MATASPDNPQSANDALASRVIADHILPWFATQGWEAFGFQHDAWRAYLDGQDGLVHTPTGMGKTYAAWLGPVIEALCEQANATSDQRGVPSDLPPLREGLREGVPRCADASTATPPPGLPLKGEGFSEQSVERNRESDGSRAAKQKPDRHAVLWITPLRALAADTVASLKAPLEHLPLNWSVELRTGDVSSSVKQRQRKRLPTALVTTPESLSILLSYADARDMFKHLRCVIVDEWHELLGTKRGVLTELSLARLRQWQPALRTWGLSATLGNIDEARDTLVGPPSARSGRAKQSALIRGDMAKEIAVDTLLPDSIDHFPWSGHLGRELLPQVLEAIDKHKTTLLFTNTRSQAELWYRALIKERPDWIGEVAVHHGSLDQDIRREVERLLAQGRLRAVVCTSSLDLGVDFSPVDLVMQLGSPKGVARLMQRAGRSGHQPGAVSKVAGVPTNVLELIEFSAAREAIEERRIEQRPPIRLAMDVLVQHMVTVGMGGGFTEDELLAEVRQTHAFAELTDEHWRWAMRFVLHGGDSLKAYPQYARLKDDGDGRYVIASQKLARQHRMGIGTITSDTAMLIKFLNGRTIGSIEESFISRLTPGDRFAFAGRNLQLVAIDGMTAKVRSAPKLSGKVPRWNGARFPLSTQLAAGVRRRLEQARDGEALDDAMRCVMPLLQSQAQASHIPSPDELLIESTRTTEGYHTFLFPFEGRLAHEGLAALIAHRLTKARPLSVAMNVNDYGIELLSPEPLREKPSNEEDGENRAGDEPYWREVLSTDNLIDDLLACLNATQMARRQFRDIARIAGLLFPGYPGEARSRRHLQASSDLFFDVFHEFDPGNLLMDQARREVLDQQLEVKRLRDALHRLRSQRIVLMQTQQLTPLSFPLWADRLREQHVSSEKWQQRIERAAAALGAATGSQSKEDAAAPSPYEAVKRGRSRSSKASKGSKRSRSRRPGQASRPPRY